MSGFLSDGVRDYIAVFGLLLALFQTWLAVKSIRREGRREGSGGAERSPPRRAAARRDYETSVAEAKLREDAFFERQFGASLLVLAFLIGGAGIGIIHASASGYPVFAALDVEIVALACTMLSLTAVMFGGYILIEWSKKTDTRPVLTASLVYGLWIAITALAVVAIWWNVDKEVRGPFAKAAVMFGAGTLIPVLAMVGADGVDALRDFLRRRRSGGVL